MISWTRFIWALRKMSLPVDKDGLVLDVGSGGTPYPRSDVLLDRLTGAEHRCGDSMMIDRHGVLGDSQKMPFKDKVFDFVVASHILEHMAHPEIFLRELQRVGKAGYIEVPNAIFERFIPYDIHCLEVMSLDGVLHIHKKARPVEDSFMGGLNFFERDDKWRGLFFKRPDMFHVRLFWDHEIYYKVHNPEVSCEWIESFNEESLVGEVKDGYRANKSDWRKIGLNILNSWYSIGRKKRLRNFDLRNILCCPECRGDLMQRKKYLRCESCNVDFVYDPIPDFTSRKS